MNRILVTLLFFSFLVFTQAQTHTSYDWERNPTISQLTESEKKESAIGIKKTVFVEYVSSFLSNSILVYETYHTIIRANDEVGIRKNNKVYIQLNQIKTILSIKARAINPKGEIQNFDQKNIKEIQNVKKYGAFKIFAIEGVEMGSDIEVLYTVEKEYSPFGNQTIQEELPIREYDFYFIYGDLNGKVKNYNTNVSFESFLYEGKKAERLALKNIPAEVEEDYSTPKANKSQIAYQCFGHTVHLSQKEVWNRVIENISDGYFPSFIEEKIQSSIDKIIRTPKSKDIYKNAALLDDYVKTNFTVVENNNPELNNIEYILTNKSASKTGIIKIYAQYLTAMEIPYELVFTANRYLHKVDSSFFITKNVSEQLIYLPTIKKYIVPSRVEYQIDGKGMYPVEYRLGEASYTALGNVGAFLNKQGVVDFKKITQVDKDYNRIEREITLTINNTNEEKVIIDEHQEYSGYWAVTNRTIMNLSEKEGRNSFQDYLTGSGIEDKKTEKIELVNDDVFQLEYNKPFVVNSRITSETLLQNAGDMYIFEIGKVIGTQSELYQEKKRIHPIEMQYPNRYRYDIRLKIPKGHKPDGLESLKIHKELSQNGKPLCSFHSDYEIVNDELRITINEIYNTNEIPLEKYEEFRQVINAASDFNKATILIAEED